MVKSGKVWVGVNTYLTNHIAERLISKGLAEGILSCFPWKIKREQKVDDSRLDFMLSHEEKLCYVEVKNVTWVEGETALFPDAITTRGVKHLKALTKLARKKQRMYLLPSAETGLFLLFSRRRNRSCLRQSITKGDQKRGYSPSLSLQSHPSRGIFRWTSWHLFIKKHFLVNVYFFIA